MSILTKISVVVLLVLILLACPVFITQATIAPNYRAAYEQQLAKTQLEAMRARSHMLLNGQLVAQRDAAIAEAERFRQQTQQELARMTANLGAWQTKSAEQENNLKNMTTQLSGLRSAADTFNKRNELLASQLDESRTEIDKLTKENLRTSEMQKQTEAEKERLDKIARVHAERIAELEQENEQLRQSGAQAKAGEAELVPVAPEGITGSITSVKGDYASINIGSANGIKPNMQLIIYRGDQLVGFLRVEGVDVNQAAGIVTDRQLDPLRGDKVTTSLLR